MSHHIVEAINVQHSYGDGTRALNGVTFRISHGEAVAIIGANGAGKSTLLQHLNGCFTPSAGEVRIGDIPVVTATLPKIRQAVGMVFQDPDDQLFMPTVFEDVAFGPLNMGILPADVELRVIDALTQVGALHLRSKPPQHLSGGEKKRVAIATVLSMSPNILVMDEPTSGLDPYARRQLISILKNFAHTRIIATHDLDMVLDVCSRVIVLQAGVVVADGTPGEIFNNQEMLASCHLEKPFSMQGCPVCGTAM